VIRLMLAATLLLSSTAYAQDWEETAASLSSLRAFGAKLVSSDSETIKDGKLALITYWKAARGKTDVDYYRCVDEVTSGFEFVSQQCWKIKAAKSRRPVE